MTILNDDSQKPGQSMNLVAKGRRRGRREGRKGKERKGKEWRFKYITGFFFFSRCKQ